MQTKNQIAGHLWQIFIRISTDFFISQYKRQYAFQECVAV